MYVMTFYKPFGAFQLFSQRSGYLNPCGGTGIELCVGVVPLELPHLVFLVEDGAEGSRRVRQGLLHVLVFHLLAIHRFRILKASVILAGLYHLVRILR